MAKTSHSSRRQRDPKDPKVLRERKKLRKKEARAERITCRYCGVKIQLGQHSLCGLE